MGETDISREIIELEKELMSKFSPDLVELFLKYDELRCKQEIKNTDNLLINI